MNKLFARIYQGGFKLFSPLLPWREPVLLTGEGAINKLPALIKAQNIQQLLIVTDSTIIAIGLMDELLQGLSRVELKFVIYDKTIPNPTIDNIEEALIVYKNNNCQAILAFGGGSAIDCAKGVGARIARPNKSIPQMKGLLRVRKRIPTLFAVPTTAGTGSETTVAAVVTNSKTHEKYAINDMSLIPHFAVLDPLLTVNLPPQLTATTGMDALTHAVEAYIGRSNTKQTWTSGRDAVSLILENLEEVYLNGANIEARGKMQRAAYLAGFAFTSAYVGYVHAIAHTLGGFYSLPHGLANAIILPYVLECYGESAYKPLAELADLTGICLPEDSNQQKAAKFIAEIRRMNKSMNIPEKVKGILTSDIPKLAQQAIAEANPLYPVPKILELEDLIAIYEMIKE
ncbi:MAG: iron-containing alcohol dehydrogenase [Clostridia bacterium]